MKISARMKVLGTVTVAVLGAGLGAAWAQTPGGTSPAQNAANQIVNSVPSRTAAGAPTVGARYQYMCQTDWPKRMYDADALAKLNELGKQGWHLLPPMITRAPGQPYADVYCFERAY